MKFEFRNPKDMLHIKNISKSFGGTNVLQNVSFEIPAGKVTALIGPNGAGKTTLFDVVSGIVAQDNGSLLLRVGEEMRDISTKETFERMCLGISRTFQQVKLCENLTIEDHFRMVEDHEDEYILNVFKDSAMRGEVERKTAQKQYSKFLSEFDLKKPLDTCVLDLSYGQRKLLDFGLAMYRKHVLLMLDEPVAGVNQVIRKRIHHLLKDLKIARETILLIEHDIDFVRALADEVIVLDEGKVLTEGKPEQVLSEKKVLEAYLGE